MINRDQSDKSVQANSFERHSHASHAVVARHHSRVFEPVSAGEHAEANHLHAPALTGLSLDGVET